MPLLSVSENSNYSQDCRKRTLSNFTDVVRNFTYGENADMIVLDLGTPTSGDGIILEVQNVFQLNDTMLQTFRIILEFPHVESFENEINFDHNSIVFTVYFAKPKTRKYAMCYNWMLPLISNPLLYFGLLCIWNPTRYLAAVPL
jgi:hypothetical protein